MTDEELVRAVAEKIMGYKEITRQRGTAVEFRLMDFGYEFDPLMNREHFGRLWMKFMDMREGRRALMRWMLEMIQGDGGK